MRHITAACLIAAHVTAAPCAATSAIQVRDGQDRVGAFAGVRLRVPLGTYKRTRGPFIGLSIEPSRHGSGKYAGHIAFGEGVSLDFQNGAERPRLMLGGRSIHALAGQDDLPPGDDRAGISTLGWVGIGVSVIVVGGALFVAWVAQEASTCPDGSSSHGGC